jgi:hypothetical protein
MLCLFGAAGCFNPQFPSGIVCGDNGACPGDLTCNLVSQICERSSAADGSVSVDSTVPTVDANTLDAPAACLAFESKHFDACSLPSPGAMALSDGLWIYDTDSGVLLDPQGNPTSPPSVVDGDARILSIDSYTDTTNVFLRVIGSRPLIIASWSTIRVDGFIIVRSNSSAGDGLTGAGANPAVCQASAASAGESGTDGGGGGGGGSFQLAGGMGGGGATMEAGITIGGAAGGVVAVPSVVRGGCAGANGGNGDQPEGGDGGAGGGAVQLTAFGRITITGFVLAGGEGGGPSGQDSGGGGGGSGGYIGFEAPEVSIESTATLASNGGAGAGGTYNNSGTGDGGQDSLSSELAANGGKASVADLSGDGGNGSARDTAAQNGMDGTMGGGGGGGGGAGYVIVWSSNVAIDGGAIVSPPQLTNP